MKAMKRIVMSLLGRILFLSACGQTPPTTQTAPTSVVQEAITTPSPTLTNTSTPVPTETPSASITPLPTIPTFTPTFDTSTIATVTPAPKAECPKEDSSLPPNLTNTQNYPLDKQQILDSLNRGVSLDSIANAINHPGFMPSIISEDVTGDDRPELLLINSEPIYHLYIYICNQGKYILTFPEISYFGYDTEIIAIKDLDADGIPEIIVKHRGCSGNGCYSIYILELNGNKFQVMNADSKYGEQMEGLIKVELKDLNKDRTFEILMTGGIPAIGSYIINPPWRLETKILAWNGKVFGLESVKYEFPQFRFQAVQDGDRATIEGIFDKAIKSYQETISNKDLDWWSPQRQTNTMIKLDNEGYSTMGTPASGTADSTEYPRLAAYAYYRIMLIHIVQGNESNASTTYKTLQEKFGNDPYGQPYVEMTNEFWNVYQSTHKMYDSCGAAIQYAAEHPEILIPLGSDYHGSQSHIYVPADVCPFR